MKIVGLCKTNSCNEFIEAILEASYDHLYKIVFVHSDRNWLGKSAPDEVRNPVSEWKAGFDSENKIIQLEYPETLPISQMNQYNYGYRYIKEFFNPDWIYVFDSDELLDYQNWRLLKKLAEKSHEFNGIACHMHTYLKSPFYRVEPSELCKPAILIRPCRQYMQGIRGNYHVPRLLPDVYMHHYTYVRKKEEDIFKKIWTSLAGDREAAAQTELVDMNNWIKNKWDKMPHSTDLHTTKHYEHSWKKIKIIGMEDVPLTLRDKPIIKQFTKEE